ncbi:hypothetical protein DSECCO2_572120 [anaerobic digester metagenome]
MRFIIFTLANGSHEHTNHLYTGNSLIRQEPSAVISILYNSCQDKLIHMLL